MKAVCEALGVARSNIAAGVTAPIAKPLKGVGRPSAPEEELVARIKAIIGDQPTYGRRVWALLKREGRLELAEACNRFLPVRARLDALGYEDPDIFAHS